MHTITPRHPDTVHNFGPASTRDEIVHTSERPGGDPQGATAQIFMNQVQGSIDFMLSQNIQQVMVLLEDNELDIYEAPGLLAKYQQNNLQVHRNPMTVVGSAANAQRILVAAAECNEKIVCHCTHGMGRSGRIAAGWLVMKYGLSPEAATKEALATARTHGMERMGDVDALTEWLTLTSYST